MSRFIRTDYHAGQIFIPHRGKVFPACLCRMLSWFVKPHQAGDAHSMEARVVMRVISCTWVGPRPCDRSIRRAWMYEEQDNSSSFTWHSIVRFPMMTTPSTRMEVTLLAPCKIDRPLRWFYFQKIRKWKGKMPIETQINSDQKLPYALLFHLGCWSATAKLFKHYTTIPVRAGLTGLALFPGPFSQLHFWYHYCARQIPNSGCHGY